MKIILAAMALLLAGGAAQAGDGPFGISMGDKPDALGCDSIPNRPTHFRCKSVPKPHPDMEYYVVQATPDHGICFVKGVGRDFPTNGYGTTIRSNADRIADQVSVKYGTGEKTDILVRGSIWDEPDDWTMSLVQDERFYGYIWERAGLPDDVLNVALSGSATSRSEGYVSVDFSFANKDDCERAERAAGADAF